jgi:DNA-binding NarL/FixJ family response regulator
MSVQIMLAEDHEKVRTVLRTMLEARPSWHVCGEAKDGCEAVKVAAQLKPDVIVMDLSMPCMDGISAAREILAASPSVPIVLYTMHYSAQLEKEAQKAGIRSVISKAGINGDLCDAIERIIERRD